MRHSIALVGSLLLAGALVGCPAQGIPTYDPCDGSQRCQSDRDRCVEIVYPGPSGEGIGSMCTTQRCVSDADCPFDVRGMRGVCLQFDAAPSTCFERCSRVGDCALGWACRSLAPIGGGTVDVCVPEAAAP